MSADTETPLIREEEAGSVTRMEGMWNASRAKLSTHASMMVSSDGPPVFSDEEQRRHDFDELDFQDREFVADFYFAKSWRSDC